MTTILNGELHVIWRVEDVLQQAEDSEISCTREQASHILELMAHYHDCNVGITRDTIDYWLCELERGRLP